MKYIYPDYYDRFRCIAEKCRHNCCIGWEIDIDPDTLEWYQNEDGAFGQRLMESIAQNGETACFILGEQERCPFLNDRNLCDIFIHMGEDALCQICTDHPRFRNFFAHQTEVGLGLCCEAAGQLILCQQSPVQWLEEDDGEPELPESEELALLALRKDLFSILQDRRRLLDDRFREAAARAGASPRKRTPRQWAALYRKLERLDPAWDRVLDRLSDAPADLMDHTDPRLACVGEQLAVYFLYRHMADGLADGRIESRVLFAIHGAQFLLGLMKLEAFPDGNFSMERAVELARLYSSEIEYDEENINTLLEQL